MDLSQEMNVKLFFKSLFSPTLISPKILLFFILSAELTRKCQKVGESDQEKK